MDETFTECGRFVIDPDHPSLPGHFPGRPIVPGVVLLDHALALLLPPLARATSLPGVKFTAAVRAGEAIEVWAGPARHGRIDFTGRRDGQVVLRGSVVAGE